MNIDEKLKHKADEAIKNSYSPYSRVKVGAALLCSDGTIYSGTNVENASYSITLCAERVAIFKAVSEGRKKFDKMLIVSNSGPLTPCGACRQAMLEFSPNMEVIVADGKEQKKWNLQELLPSGFTLAKE